MTSHDKLAYKLFSCAKKAVEIDPALLQKIFDVAEPGWTALEEPEAYRYFLIKDFLVKDFGVTLKSIIRDADPEMVDPEQETAQHDRIVELLESGAEEWPAIVASGGVILDGYHRIAAHRTLNDAKMDVIVAVDRPGEITEREWERNWNEMFP